MSDLAALLRQNSLFSGLDSGLIERMAALCHVCHLRAGETLFFKGDDGNGLFGICSGKIRIETATVNGEALTLNVLGPGELFGEIALLDGRPRTADAVAIEATELLTIRRHDFLALILSDARLAIPIIELLCQRLRWMSERVEEANLEPLPVRLARRLALLVTEKYGGEVNISQEQLARYVGAARESVNRQLQIWRRNGILDLGRGRVIIRDMERLEAVCKLD